MTDPRFPTDGSFVPTPAQAAYADQQYAAVNAVLDRLVTEAMLSADLGLSGTELAVSIGLLCADEVPTLAPTEADELGALLALVGAAVVRLAAPFSDAAGSPAIYRLREALAAVDALPSTPPTQDHRYISTACLHDRHDQCGVKQAERGETGPPHCKYCDSVCSCPVCRHTPPTTTGGSDG